MESLKANLKKQLNNAQRVALLGVGSELRGDDAAGVFVARKLCPVSSGAIENKRYKVFIGETAPENLTGQIKSFNPTHLIIVDSAQMNEEAGAVKLIDSDEVSGFSSSTHSLPMKVLADYLFKSIGCKTTIIGIQPKALDFGMPLSPEVKKSVKCVWQALKAVLGTTIKTND